ncbi:MAG TPA: transglycosylase SLT domain-containing protein [Gemmatimonadaceae bacterium]|nr:transglycosylase SLT domain-containing protein [Gemmatimonadaceae bacterium]
MSRFVGFRVAAIACAVACAKPEEAPAQVEAAPSPYSTSRDATVRAAGAAVAAGRPWRATEIIDSAAKNVGARSPELVLLSATAAAAWGGWSRVERDLANAPWIDSMFDGQGRELLARAALARGADSVAQSHAERALVLAKTDRERGVREVLLARALDRRALGDSAAAMYLRAARHLPSLADWLELRAAGATADASARQRSYARIKTPVARARVAPTEAQARERWRDYAGAARAYAEQGERVHALRLRMLTEGSDDASRAKLRGELFSLLSGTLAGDEARMAVTLADSSYAPLSPAEQLLVARAASSAGLLARAATGFARGGTLDARDRHAYAMILSRLGRDSDAAIEFSRVEATSPLGASAAYQQALSLLRAGRRDKAKAALSAMPSFFPRDTVVAAQSQFLLADLATDDLDDRSARASFLDLAKRFPSHPLAPSALFHAAIIAYAANDYEGAARDLESLVQRYPKSGEVSAARYWTGRAREGMGDRARAAERWREVIATDPLSYYAMRSAARLRTTAWMAAEPAASPKPAASLERAVARAALLETLGMNTEEGFEYDDIAAAGRSPDSLLAAAEALRSRSETSRAMSLARRALSASAPRDTRVLRLMYPLPFGDVIRAEAKAHHVDASLGAALIHQESSFNPRAVSRAGAVGLMQVLPSVGASIAKAQRIASFERVMLFQPDVNVRLGMAHLDAMLRQYPGIEYALAAYNAGGSPVRRWRQKRGTDDPELFIERIPYEETRDYVRILLRNQSTYRTLYGS